MNHEKTRAREFANEFGVTLELLSWELVTRTRSNGERFDYKLHTVRLSRRFPDGTSRQHVLEIGLPLNLTPSMYDALAALETWEPGPFEKYCADYGFEPTDDTRRGYEDVKREYAATLELFGDCLERLEAAL